jgi:hypothetical protein
MLWRDDAIGWVKIAGKVEARFANGAVPDGDFRREFEAEVERFRVFLGAAHLTSKCRCSIVGTGVYLNAK